jgi:transposase
MLEVTTPTAETGEKRMINMAQYHRIKWLSEREGFSQRQIAAELGVSRNTVRKYVTDGQAPTSMQRRQSYSNRTFSDEILRILPVIDEWLTRDESVWKKQRHTAVRIYQRLVEEYGSTGSASSIRKVVARRRRAVKKAFIPLQFQRERQIAPTCATGWALSIL